MENSMEKLISKSKAAIAALIVVLMVVSLVPSKSMAAGGIVTDFVERLYTVALGRNYDASGRDYWVGELNAHRKNGAEVARGFFFSDEFINKGLGDDEFVTRLYRTFMNREPDAGGKSYWLNEMGNGMSRKRVFDGFINSNEWANICASFGIISGGTGIADKCISDFVERIYTVALNRNSDPSGKKYWADKITTGSMTGTQVAYGFFFSDELNNKNLSKDEFLTRLYGLFFNRAPDKTGYDYWMSEINKGMTKTVVFNGFANSKEWGELCAIYGIEKGTAKYAPSGYFKGESVEMTDEIETDLVIFG